MLSPDAVSQIKAAQGIYRASDVAKHYDVHRSTVKRIWEGAIHNTVAPAPDFPDIAVRYKPQDLQDDIRILLERGRSIKEVAQDLNISPASVWLYQGVFL